jgi:hypothetical protein
MSLRTGVELISLSMLFNKVTGFYGLLAFLNGLHLSSLQLSMYIYSVAALVLLAFLMPHIRKQSPFQNLALAYFYLFDTLINTAFTYAFAFTWFLAVSANEANKGTPNAPGSGTIDKTAGFTSPEYNASSVDVISSGSGGQEGLAFAASEAAVAAINPSVGNGVMVEESIPSMIVVVFFTAIRFYFILIMLAYARQVLRQHIYSHSPTKLHLHTDGSVEAPAENPFAVGAPQGSGWRGMVGRVMVKAGEGYWLGGQADDTWAKGLDGKFRSTRVAAAPLGPPGTIERERRARSGTGPPVPSASVLKTAAAGQV